MCVCVCVRSARWMSEHLPYDTVAWRFGIYAAAIEESVNGYEMRRFRVGARMLTRTRLGLFPTSSESYLSDNTPVRFPSTMRTKIICDVFTAHWSLLRFCNSSKWIKAAFFKVDMNLLKLILQLMWAITSSTRFIIIFAIGRLLKLRIGHLLRYEEFKPMRSCQSEWNVVHVHGKRRNGSRWQGEVGPPHGTEDTAVWMCGPCKWVIVVQINVRQWKYKN